MRRTLNTKIKLEGITVVYNKTTLDEFIRVGYEVKDEGIVFHEESSTVMCSFFKDKKYMGELVFFDIHSMPSVADLKANPIGLVLLDEEPQEDKSFRAFMEFKGKVGKKDVKFLIGFYLFAWLMILVGYKNIPVELIYVTAVLPFAFFGTAFLFWLLKRFFSFLFGKVSLTTFVLSCSCLFLLWTGLLAYSFMRLNKYDYNWMGIPVSFSVIILLLGINVFLSYQIVLYWFFKSVSFKPFKRRFRYLPLHILLYIPMTVVIYFSKTGFPYLGQIVGGDSFVYIFIMFLFIQCLIYCMFSFIIWVKVLIY